MGSSEFLVEVVTVQGGRVLFGPYPRDLAQRVVDDFRPRIGSDELVFSPATDASGRPAGAWSIGGRSIASVRVVPSAASAPSPSGRLQRTSSWRQVD